MGPARRLLGVLVATLSSVASACPVCGGAATSPQSQSAYIGMSILLSVLPLLGIGAVVGWVAMSVRASDRSGSRDER